MKKTSASDNLPKPQSEKGKSADRFNSVKAQLGFSEKNTHQPAEKALLQSEERLRLALSATGTGMWEWEVLTQQSHWSPEHFRLLGYEPETVEPSYENWMARVHPEDLSATEAAIRQSVNKLCDFRHDFRVIWLDGSVHWLEAKGSYFYNSDGVCERMIGVMSDITERKVVEEQLSQVAHLNSFRVALSNTLRSLTDPFEIQKAAIRILGRYLRVNRVIYAEVDEKQNEALVAENYVDGVEELIGRISLGDFKQASESLRLGEPVIISDVATDSNISDSERESYKSLGIVSTIRVSLVKDGNWVSILEAHHFSARQWTNAEIQALRETAERIWDAIERARSEKALQTSEERFRLVVQSAPNALLMINSSGEITFVNSQAEMLFGYRPPELIGKTIEILVPERYRGKHIDFRAGFLENPQVRQMGAGRDLYCLRKDGLEVPVEIGLNPMVTNEGEFVLISIIDITRRKEAEKTKAQLASIVESSQDAMVTIRPDNKILTWNTAAERMFGYTAEEAIGQPVSIIMPDTKQEESEILLKRRLKGETIPPFETVRKHKNGSLIDVSVAISPVKNSQNIVIGSSAILRDITEQKRVEKTQREKEILQKMVAAQEDERRRLARDLHDQLGQQLTSLRLKLEYLKGICQDEKIADQIDEMQSISGQIDADIDFLAWELRPSALDDLGIVAALARYIDEWERHFEVSVDFDANHFKLHHRLDPEIETNLYRIAQESLNNIAKHARANRVDISLKYRDGSVVLVIEDDGVGFSTFKKIPEKSTGLIGMRERAALVGGSLKFESAPGKGTTIYVVIPLEKAREEKKNE